MTLIYLALQLNASRRGRRVSVSQSPSSLLFPSLSGDRTRGGRLGLTGLVSLSASETDESCYGSKIRRGLLTRCAIVVSHEALIRVRIVEWHFIALMRSGRGRSSLSQ